MESRRELIRHNRVGGETPDSRPIELPVGGPPPLTLREEMMRFIRMELSKSAEQKGEETFEEFDDFSIDDEEPDLTSPYTVTELQDEEGAYLLEPTSPDDSPFVETPSLEDRSEATGAEGALDTEPREVDKQSSP